MDGGMDTSCLRQMQHRLEEHMGRLDLQHGEVEVRMRLRQAHITAPYGHLTALENAGWRAAGGVGACPLAARRSLTPLTATPHRSSRGPPPRDAVLTIFDVFDADGDGYWCGSEANDWLRATQNMQLDDDDWNGTCQSLGADPEVGLSLELVRHVYTEHDPIAHLELLQCSGFSDPEQQQPKDPANVVWSAMDDEEDASEYCRGGYHPVQPGNVFEERYTVHSKLGWGQFSTVWLAKDEQTARPVALKISKAAQDFRDTSAHEINVLEQMNLQREDSAMEDGEAEAELKVLRAFGQQCVSLFSVFDITGPHGTHSTMAMEAVGPNLLKIATSHDFNGISPAIVKALTRQVLEGLAFTHDLMQLAHCDLKPENILLCTLDEAAQRSVNGGTPIDHARTQRLLKGEYDPPQPGESLADCVMRQYKCKVSDFGSTRWVERDNPPQRLQTLEYRAPEIVLEYPPDTGIDVFSCACMVFELLTGNFLFNPKNQTEFNQDHYHLLLFQQYLGAFPERVALGEGLRCPEFFDDRGVFMYQQLEDAQLEEALVSMYMTPPDEARELASFLLPMLELDFTRRASAQEMLKHPWLEIREGDGKLSPQAEAKRAEAAEREQSLAASSHVSGEDIVVKVEADAAAAGEPAAAEPAAPEPESSGGAVDAPPPADAAAAAAAAAAAELLPAAPAGHYDPAAGAAAQPEPLPPLAAWDLGQAWPDPPARYRELVARPGDPPAALCILLEERAVRALARQQEVVERHMVKDRFLPRHFDILSDARRFMPASP